MPCYHFVFHAYGSWNADHPRGWHQHGVAGTQRPSEPIANHRDRNQNHPTVTFNMKTQRALINMAIDACVTRGIQPHVIGTNETHLHLVASWTGDRDAVETHYKIKNLLGLRAAEANGTLGRPWISHGGIPKRVRDGKHLNQLVRDYVVKQGGAFWREGDPVPEWEDT
jgi:hypothetical protein